MSLYQIDRPRNTTFVGKFKFNYFATIRGRNSPDIPSTKAPVVSFPTNANIGFDAFQNEFRAGLTVGQLENGIYTYSDPNNKKVYLALIFSLKGPGGQTEDDPVVFDIIDFDNFRDFDKTTSGTVEGYVYYGAVMNEYVDILEYYPSKDYFVGSPVCPDNENQYWYQEELNEKTVRHWPKYTTINWFEAPDPTKKAKMGIFATIVNDKGKAFKINKNFERNPPLFDFDYVFRKTCLAYAGPIANNGYISVSSNVPLSNESPNLSVSTISASCDTENFSVNPLTSDIYYGYKSSINIDMLTDASRKVSFESLVSDWNLSHTDELTAYIVGFGSKGELEYYNNPGSGKRVPYAKPSFETVTTKSGIISPEGQTYRFYNGSISAHSDRLFLGLPDQTDSKSIYFDNRQKWIYGMIDGTKENFDDLESPPKDYDYPQYWVRSADGCKDINEYPRLRTLDETDLPSGYLSIPIPLKGWKFNAMTLKQNPEYVLSANSSMVGFGLTNKVSFLGTKGEPYYYGSENLSGYRYLHVDLISKNNDSQSTDFTIKETSKGFTLENNFENVNEKTWKLSIPANKNGKSTYVIDLCNPDNKVDFVDNQDSPYPRLNTYTTSKPKSTKPFGLLAVENKPKDNFLVTKSLSGDESKTWINDALKKQIRESGIIYLSDDISKNIDYFEVNTSALPKAGVGTNIIFGRPRVFNGKIKLAKYFNANDSYLYDSEGQIIGRNLDYFKQIEIYIVNNDLTSGKTIDDILLKDKDGKYPEEFEIYDYDPGYPDISEKIGSNNVNFVDGQQYIFVNPIPVFENNYNLPYDGVVIEDKLNRKEYKLIDYIKTDTDQAYIVVQTPAVFNQNIVFKPGASIKLTFTDGKTDDRFSSLIVKFSKVDKISSNRYKAFIEYTKLDKNSQANYDGIPETLNNNITYFSANAPIITVKPPRLVEFNFPIDTLLYTQIKPSENLSNNEVNAIDDYPQDEASNGPYYGVSRIASIETNNKLVEFENLKLIRQNSLSNFVYSGNNNTFERQTKFDASTTTYTEYFTRRFWQQNTDARDEEEGDITWQHTTTPNVDFWNLFPKSISQLCDDINKKDEYVAPRWLNPNNPSSIVTRHPGWEAQKVDKSYPIDPITGDRIFSIKLDPEYLNSDTGLATWIFGGGMLAVPSGKNSGSGTSYIKAINVSFNDMKTILAQTIFHRINADFPPGKPDLFGNTSLTNDDGTVQESTLHLRGGFVARGPGYGLILPPKKSKPSDIRKANLIEAATLENKGSSESNSIGYFETSSPFGKNKVDHYIELEKSNSFSNPSSYRSSTRNFTQAKRERAAYKGGKQNIATNLSSCESGFEKSIVIAYTIPTTKPGDENQTAVITTDSFFTTQYEKYPVGYNIKTGIGVTVKGAFPNLVSSEKHLNISSKVNSFLLTERSSIKASESSHNYESLIAANTDMRNKQSWFPYIDGQAKTDTNFSTLSKAFKYTKNNSYVISDQYPMLLNVGYSDPGAIIFRSISLNTTSINAPVTDKNIFIDGVAPTYTLDFRLIDPFLTTGFATSTSSIAQITSRDYMVAYVMKETPRKINFKLVTNYQVQEKNTLLDLDLLSGNNLSDKYNIYGLTSDYDASLGLFRSVFWSNGSIFYFEYDISSGNINKKNHNKLHLVKGNLSESLIQELVNRKNIVLYYDAKSELNAEVPIHKPAITSSQKQEYKGAVIATYDTGKCYLESVLFYPYKNILGIRKFDIECVNTSDSTVKESIPVAFIQANPLSGQSALSVTFLSNGSYDPDGSDLTYLWNFGDDTQSTDANPIHTFVNKTTDPIQFTVTLIVTNTTGISSDPTTVTITVNPAPINNLLPQAKFSVTPTSGPVALTVTFTDQSTPVNDGSKVSKYFWDTGDGNTFLKTDSNPFTFDYTRAGKYTPTLQVVDSLDRPSNKFIGPQIIVDGVLNNPPAPSFTWSQTSYSPTLKVQFNDTSFDVEGPLVAWHWDFGDTQTADVQNPEHIYANPGTYLVVLTVTDSGGLQASGTIPITVLPPGNNPPIANFNYSQQNRKLVIDFTDTSSDSDGTIVSWNWDFGDTFTDSVQNPSHTYALSGTYQVTLTVTDNGGKSNSITKNVIVAPLVNLPPIISSISGTQTSFKPSLIVKFTEISSDPDGYITKWDWNFGDGQTFSTTDPALKNPSHTFFAPGIYTITLTVTDDGLPDGSNKKSATSFIRFTVSPPPANQPPIALFSVDANNILAPATINFTDLSTDTDGKIISWFWEFEAGSSIFYNLQTYQKTVSHKFLQSGTYPVKLTVTDDGNSTNTYVLDIIIKNNPPVAVISAFPNPVLSQNQVVFNGTSSYDTDGNITKYTWDFGDGSTILQGRTQETHTYQKPGSYRASLTVTDNSGDTNTANLIITVNNRNPVAIINYTTLTVKAPGSLTFNGDKSYDLDGSISSYSWTSSNGLSASTPNATFSFTTEGTYTIYLTVTDDAGGTNTTSVNVIITPPDNILPIAILNVDKNSGVINDAFTFNTIGSYDPDGTIVLFRLDFGDSTNTQFVTPAPVSHIYSSVGIFTAKLFVVDNRSGQSIETLQSVQKITINNQPPVSNFKFSPNNAYTFDVVKFTDNSTDPENNLSKWVWDFGDNTSFTTTDPLSKSPSKSYNKGKRDYTVFLTVYDNLGLSNTSSQIVSILNRKPFAVISTNFTPTNNTIIGIAPFTVIFDSNSYDLDGTVANYEWYLQGISGTPITTKSFTYTFTTARFTPYIVTLRVQDDDGDWSDVVSIGVKVNAPNIPPVAVINAKPLSNTSQAPITVDFSGAGSYDPDNVAGPLSYAWDFGNSSISDQVNAITTYDKPGTYSVTLTVTDNLGATNTATLDYIVKNSKPIAVLDTVPSGITQVQINTSITFTSQGSNDPDTGQFINGYKWLVDGVNQNSNTSNLTTSFGTIGNHVVTLSVFDNLGLESNSVSKTIFVVSAPPPPPANKNPIAILGNEPGPTGYIELKVGDSFTFDGSTSYDPEDGANITYEWSVNGVKSGFTSTFTNQFSAIGVYTVSLVVFDTQKLASTPLSNLGKRYTVDVNVSAAPNPLANKLFSTGYGYYGAIASGDNLTSRFGFQLVDDRKQYTIISAGGNHTLVVDSDGKLYASGSNSNGQLGFASNITQLNSLTLVPLPSNYKVVEVSAGDLCSAIIVEDISINKRILLGCGDNINGIFGQSLPKTNIFTFQPILEKPITNNGVSYLSSNNLSKISCNNSILAFIHNKQVWVSGLHNYINKLGITDSGFIPINIDPNPDINPANTNYLNPFKLQVGKQGFGGYVCGLAYDIDSQIVWFTGITTLRGWGYAYDISSDSDIITIIAASQDLYDRTVIFYGFQSGEVPKFWGASLPASFNFPGEFFVKISLGTSPFFALSQNHLFVFGGNDFGSLGLPEGQFRTPQFNLQANLPPYFLSTNDSVIGAYDISAGRVHAILLASDVKPSGYSFTIIRPGGYPYVDNLTAYPITQIA